MLPNDINYVYKQTTNIKFENDPYSEMYYHIKIKEKEEGASLEASRLIPFLSNNQKDAIKRENMNKLVVAKNFTKLSQSLGTVEIRNKRSQARQLDLGDLKLDDEPNSKATHLRVLASIEVPFGFSMDV